MIEVRHSNPEPDRARDASTPDSCALSSPTESRLLQSTIGAPVTSRAVSKNRRLIANQRYFGLRPRALLAGLRRALGRVSAQPAGAARLDVASLVADFGIEGEDGPALVRLLVAGRLLEPCASDEYRPTSRFREYAKATIVEPLSRERAKALIDRVRDVAARINAHWPRNPFVIRMVAVSGSYMSRRSHLPELCLWVVLRQRRDMTKRRWRRALGNGEALRQILVAINSLSSFIVVRIVADNSGVQRPFAVVFESGDPFVLEPVHAWERFRDWGASISQRLGAK